MADGYCTYMPEMDDVHQWLPSEVLRDIGIADRAERRRLAVVEDLAARLAGVLGGGAPNPEEMAATNHTRHLPSSCHRPHGPQGHRDHRALAGAAQRPFMPLPLMTAPRQEQALAGVGPRNSMVLRPAAALHQPRQLAPALSASHPHPLFRGAVAAGAAQPVAMTGRGGGGGTGFFLPRTSTATAVPARQRHAAANNVPARQCQAQRRSRRGHEAAAAATARRQHELIAQANMVQMQQLAGAPELALPQEWSY